MNPTKRFSDRVTDYVKYRPSYPAAMVEWLASTVGAGRTVADVGSGTGILSRLLLPHFAKVIGVEPNLVMRGAGNQALGDDPRFVSVDGTAEAATLANASVDLVTAAQAFHWFDQPRARREFQRILRPRGRVALIWNDRLNDTAFLVDYEAGLQKYATDYNEVNHQNIQKDELARFYGGNFEFRTFPNSQEFDFAGVMGRLDSSSYAPKPGTDAHTRLKSLLAESFHRNAHEGKVRFRYQTLVYFGEIQ